MEFSASQIARLTGGVVEGNPDVTVSDFAKIEEGRPGTLTFLSNQKYTHFIYSTEASIVLVKRDFVPEHPVKATMIRVDDPYATLAMLLETVSKALTPVRRGIEQPCYVAEGVELPEDVYVGAFAYIAPGAVIEPGVQIHPQVYVGDNVRIGAGTILYPGVKVYHGCRIGARCILHSGAVIGADGFGFAPVGETYQKIPQLGNVVIEDDVEVGANTTIDRAVMGSTRIESGVKLDNLIQVAHNCSVGANTVMASQAGIAGSTKVGRHCMVGGQVGMAGHITVGDNVMIGAQSGISSSVKDGARVMGSPATDFRTYARVTASLKQLPDLIAWQRKQS